jgi:hypothetical protein
MYGYGKTKRRHRRLRGGLTKEQETAFLEKKQEADRSEAENIGSIAQLEKSPAVEGVGTGTKKPKVSLFQERQTEVARAESQGTKPPPAGGKRRRHSRRKTHRRRK